MTLLIIFTEKDGENEIKYSAFGQALSENQNNDDTNKSTNRIFKWDKKIQWVRKRKKELQYSLQDIFWLPLQDFDKVKNVMEVEVCAVVMYVIICLKQLRMTTNNCYKRSFWCCSGDFQNYFGKRISLKL